MAKTKTWAIIKNYGKDDTSKTMADTSLLRQILKRKQWRSHCQNQTMLRPKRDKVKPRLRQMPFKNKTEKSFNEDEV